MFHVHFKCILLLLYDKFCICPLGPFGMQHCSILLFIDFLSECSIYYWKWVYWHLLLFYFNFSFQFVSVLMHSTSEHICIWNCYIFQLNWPFYYIISLSLETVFDLKSVSHNKKKTKQEWLISFSIPSFSAYVYP